MYNAPANYFSLARWPAEFVSLVKVVTRLVGEEVRQPSLAMDYLWPCLIFVWSAYIWETYLQWRQVGQMHSTTLYAGIRFFLSLI